MRLSDKSSPLKDDLRDRSLRSSSPAIKRPASDMGAQDREDHPQDVDMQDQPLSSVDVDAEPNVLLNQANRSANNQGKRHKNDSHTSTRSPDIQSLSHKSPDLTVEAAPDGPTAVDSEAESKPTIDEQVARVLQLTQEQPKDGDKGYIVSYKWLRRVVARCSEPPTGITIDKSAMEEAIGPISNADLVLVTDQSENLKDQAGNPFVTLRPGLQLNEDFLILPEAAWNLILQWYGLDPESPTIVRYAHSLNENDPLDVQYELNPPIFTFLKVVGTHTQQTQKDANLAPPRMVASVHKPFMQWLKDAKDMVHCDINTKVRVWKIIAGLRSASASGILTPIASRSASPAPGAEIIASAGSKMILDVNTFSLLTLGDQREKVDQKDQTMNTNYNGKVDLRTLGLGRSDVIVLEEETSKPDEYPSENPRLSLKGSAKNKTLTVSGRSSPVAGSIMTRGRVQREGRPKGIVGLSNLGNTCYMNSALQCIRSVEELTEYFRSRQWHKEVNYDNPLGNHGEIAKAYGQFIEAIYSSTNSYTPAPFKRTVGKYGSQFAGYGQQDSQEFLAFLLDGLSEDLNRIHKKPYVEKPDSTDEMVHNEQLLKEFADRNWSDFKARNDSVVIDLFAGMYKSTLTCPVCDKVSIVFDPFTTLTMQLPIENNWAKEIIYFPLYARPYRIDVDIDKNSTILDLKKFVATRTHYDPSKMICGESYKNKIFKIFDNNEMIAEANINANDVICLYELSEKPTNYNPDKKKKFSQFSYGSSKDTDPKVDVGSPAANLLLTTVFHRVPRTDRMNRETMSFFAHPTFIVLSREDRRSHDALLKKLLVHLKGMTTRNFLDEDSSLPVPQSGDEIDGADTLEFSSDDEDSHSPSASAVSLQDEDGLVDISMRDAAQIGDSEVSGQSGIQKLMRARRIPPQFTSLFDTKLAMAEEGIPHGWNTINENSAYTSLRDRAAEIQNMKQRHNKHEIEDETYDSGISDVATEQDDSSKSNESEAEERIVQDEDMYLPDVSEIVPSKDTRGKSKHAKKKVYSRKGRKIVGKPSRKAPSPVRSSLFAAEVTPEGLVMPGEALILDWKAESYEAFFGAELGQEDELRGLLTHDELGVFEDSELVAKRSARQDRKKNGITLEDCLSEFQKTETLSEQNAWYCPRCKEHRRADKQFELWKAPDILVMHLKRFASTRDFRNKLEVKVEYPVEGLDLSPMVRDHSDGKSLIYDLIAVDLHYGGLGGGHYTATAKNAVTQKWYEYNDSHASQVKDVEGGVVSKHAYLLFYRRRDDPPLGGPKLAEILTEAQAEENNESRDASPPGEGRRLDDSSHNGSSSAFDRLHRVGDGGSVSQEKTALSQNRPLGGATHQIFHADEHLPPPAYNEHSEDILVGQDSVRLGREGETWSFAGLPGSAAPPSSENGDVVDITGFGGRSDGSMASSTAGMGGSAGSVGHLSDLEDDAPLHSFDDSLSKFGMATSELRQDQYPPAMHGSVSQIPFAGQGVQQEDDDDLEVQELRIDESRS